MVENLRELNEKCQKRNYRTTGNWMVRRIVRDLALYPTWVLLHLPITAHQTTALTFLTAGISGALLCWGGSKLFFAGMLMYQFWYVMDHVDGQVARYRKTSSIEGMFADFVMHHLVSFLIPLGSAFSYYRSTGDATVFIWGSMAAVSLSMMAILNDSKAKALYFFACRLKKIDQVRDDGDPLKPNDKLPAMSLPKKAFFLIYKSCEGHVLMNIWTAFALLYLWKDSALLNGIYFLLIYYGFASTLVWTTKLVHMVARRKLSREFEDKFKIDGNTLYP